MMDARFWMTDAGKYREITARELVSNSTKESTKESLMKVEQFPDGTIEVPLVSDVSEYRTGTQIGTAVVTFVNGGWEAVISLSSDAAKNLGIDLTFCHYSDSLNGANSMLVARRLE